MGRPKLVQGHPLDESESPRRLIRVEEPTPDPPPEPAGEPFDQVPKLARADQRISATAYRVLAAIEGYCWGDRRDCWATNRMLGAQAGGISAESVRRALRQLEQAKYLRVDPDNSKKRGFRLVLLYQLRRPSPFLD